MKFHELKTAPAKSAKRAGRGISAGRGKTAGRGTKGQGSRKSGGVRPGFEGGQMPLYMRIPKLRGFTSHRPKVHNIYTSDLEKLGKANVDSQVLADAGLIPNPFVRVKLISKGPLSKKVSLKLELASASAKRAIEAAGGTFSQVERTKRPSTNKKPKKA